MKQVYYSVIISLKSQLKVESDIYPKHRHVPRTMLKAKYFLCLWHPLLGISTNVTSFTANGQMIEVQGLKPLTKLFVCFHNSTSLYVVQVDLERLDSTHLQFLKYLDFMRVSPHLTTVLLYQPGCLAVPL